MFRQRLRVYFNKEGLARFLGHHDLMRLWERALRRAGLPLAYSAGYNPRPQISFPVALALGIESREEVCEAELVRWTPPRRAEESLEGKLPEGIGIVGVESMPHARKAEVTGTVFAVEAGLEIDDLPARIEAFMQRDEAFVERRARSGTKSVNARKFVEDLRLDGADIRMTLTVGPDGTARPEEVVAAILELPVDQIQDRLKIVRTRLRLAPPPQ